MALNRYIVWGISEDHLGLLPFHECRDDGLVEGVAADKTVGAQLPDITGLTECWSINRRKLVFFRISWVFCIKPLDQTVSFGDRKARNTDIKGWIDVEKIL